MRNKLIVPLVLLLVALGGCSRDPEKLKVEYVASGDRYVAEKKYAEAALQFRNAIAEDARFGEARFKLASALEKSGDLPGAYREYVRAADLMPKDITAQL